MKLKKLTKTLGLGLLLFATSAYSADTTTPDEPVSKINNVDVMPTLVSPGTTLTFEITLSEPLPIGYRVKIDFGNGIVSPATGFGTAYSLQKTTYKIGKHNYVVGIYNAEGVLESYEGGVYIVKNMNKAIRALSIKTQLNTQSLGFNAKICGNNPDGSYPKMTNVNSKSSDSSQGKNIGVNASKWSNGSTLKFATDFTGTSVKDFLYVCGLNDSKVICQNKVIQRIQTQASLWSQYGNIYFAYTPNWKQADIRIRFDAGKGSVSLLGMDSQKSQIDSSDKSMNLDSTWWNNSWIDTAITHEFGHAIGFLHEQVRGDMPYIIDKQKAYSYYEYLNPTWTDAMVDFNILNKIPVNAVNSSAYSITTYDSKSIMEYFVPLAIIQNSTICPSKSLDYCIDPNTTISELDKVGVAKFYPKPAPPPPPKSVPATPAQINAALTAINALLLND